MSLARLNDSRGLTNTGRAHHLDQPQRLSRDPLTEQPFTRTVHRVDDGPATMQIDPDVTSIHRGPPFLRRGTGRVKPRVSTTRTSRGAEAPLLHGIRSGARGQQRPSDEPERQSVVLMRAGKS
jgi:hypothetical protein